MSGDGGACVAIRSRRRGTGAGRGVSGPSPAWVRRGRPASPSLHQVPWTALVPWRADPSASRAHGSPGWWCPEASSGACAVEHVDAIAPMRHEDGLTPLRSAFAFPRVPPSLSSPRCARWIDPAGRRALPGGAVVPRGAPRGGFGAALLRDVLARRPMRRSRVPVVSLAQHALVCDPGGLCPVSPRATAPRRRARGVTRSAVPTPSEQASWGGSPVRDHDVHTPFAARYRPC